MAPIRYIAPLERALEHMRLMLFRPFGFEKWLVLGFAAFLADLDEYFSVGTWGGDVEDAFQEATAEPLVGCLPSAITDRFDFFGCEAVLTGLSAVLIAAFVIVVLAFGLALLWVNSRGKFIFLDNVVTKSAAIREPWKRLNKQGNSLFLWRLGFFFAGLLVVALLGGLGLLLGVISHSFGGEDLAPMAVAGFVLLGLPFIIPVLYIVLWVESFVLPIMHRLDLTVLPAVELFWGMLKERPLPYLLYGLVYLGLLICVFTLVTVFGLATCCLAFIWFTIPYLNALILLPISLALRAYSLAWIGQIDPRFGLDAEGDGPVSLPAESPA